MKIILSTIFVFALLFARTQVSLPKTVDFDSTKRFEFGLNSSHDIQTTSISLKFANTLLKGGELTDDFTSKTLAKQNDINRIGREFSNELYFADYQFTPFKQNKYGLFAEIGYQSLTSGIYSQDLFEMVFKGNQNFIGDSAHFSGTGFKHYDFQNIGLGLIDKKTKSFLTLNFINLQNYAAGITTKGSYFMSPDSTEVDLDLNAQSLNTYGANFNKGMGIALNLTLNFEVPWRNEKTAIFQFKIKNFGAVKVNKLNSYSVDTNIALSGFKFEDFLLNNSTDLSSISWLDTLNVRTDTISEMIVLPAMIQFGKVLDKNFTGKTQSFFGIKLYPSMHYVPKLYLGFDYKATDDFHVGATAAYGGFGVFRAGVYANYQTKKIDFGIGTEDVLGFISKNAFGQMIHLKLICTL
ncbi:MAG: hypothetical protein ACK5B9_15500 [Flavobacteriia bacterium]|jgi:hypothetical protein